MHFTDQNTIQKQETHGIEGFEILKVLKCRNEITSMDRTQRVDDKNGVICLVIMFIPRIMDIKMSRMAHFLHFLLMTPKK